MRKDYAEDRERLWARHAGRWLQELAPVLARARPFTSSFHRVVVTDAAVIALAPSSAEVDAIRAAISALQSSSGLDARQPAIVRTTPFRFGGALRSPTTLLETAERISVGARSRVHEVVVTRELVYPSLVTEDLARLPLGAAEGR